MRIYLRSKAIPCGVAVSLLLSTLLGCNGDGQSSSPAGSGDATANTHCGNGIVDPGEPCDGADLNNATCENLGRGTGTLTCDPSCQFDVSGCSGGGSGGSAGQGSCGDGVVQSLRGEECDGDKLAGASCQVFGFEEGTVTCSDKCQIDISACHHKNPCGNGTIDPNEECDGDNFGGKTCKLLGFASGKLGCTDECKLDKSGCLSDPGTCGDGVITGTEVCDHDKLGGKKCQDLTYVNHHVQGGKTFNYTSGALACASNCQSFDTSSCVEGYAGDPCTSSSQCPTLRGYVHLHNARCLTKSPSGVPFPGGYCTADCETGQMSYCCRLAAGVCVTLPAELGDGSICLAPCQGPQDCRDQYKCQEIGGSKYCLPQ